MNTQDCIEEKDQELADTWSLLEEKEIEAETNLKEKDQ